MLSNGMKQPSRPAMRTTRLYIQSSKNGVMNTSFFPHRNETRGVGGIFFDDYVGKDFDDSLTFAEKVGRTFADSYFAIFNRRKETQFSKEQKEFQKYRRGRYVEFNLVHDRGTHFGLQSGGRTESILMSLPPEVSWNYNWSPPKGCPEMDLYNNFCFKKLARDEITMTSKEKISFSP